MQCYQGEALRRQVYLEAHLLIPNIPFDPMLIDEVLDEFEASTLTKYLRLEPVRRVELAKRLNRLCLQAAAGDRRVA